MRKIPCPLHDPHNLYFVPDLDEENQIVPMPRMAQPCVQIIPLLENAGALTHFDNLRLNLGHKGCSTGTILERNEVTNVDEICPRGGQDNQLWHDQALSA